MVTDHLDPDLRHSKTVTAVAHRLRQSHPLFCRLDEGLRKVEMSLRGCIMERSRPILPGLPR